MARLVGYGSPFALSTSFKHIRGLSPQQHRAGTRSAAAVAPSASRKVKARS